MVGYMMDYHIPVLLEACISGLNIKPEGIYVDLTYGGGGHSSAILEKLTTGKVIAFDLDEDVLEQKPDDPRLILLIQNYRYLRNNLEYLGIEKVDAILADLGVSSHQFDEPGRGFAFRINGPLDMRMSGRGKIKASDLLNSYSPEELSRIFREYAEIRNPERLVEQIITSRNERPFQFSGDLVRIATDLFPGKFHNKILARIFQALRIEVNDELATLQDMLEQAGEVVRPGGRLLVISYHSLEDRLVKQYIKFGKSEGAQDVSEMVLPGEKPKPPFRQIHSKVITPGREEIKRNPRARSARLRIAERI